MCTRRTHAKYNVSNCCFVTHYRATDIVGSIANGKRFVSYLKCVEWKTRKICRKPVFFLNLIVPGGSLQCRRFPCIYELSVLARDRVDSPPCCLVDDSCSNDRAVESKGSLSSGREQKEKEISISPGSDTDYCTNCFVYMPTHVHANTFFKVHLTLKYFAKVKLLVLYSISAQHFCIWFNPRSSMSLDCYSTAFRESEAARMMTKHDSVSVTAQYFLEKTERKLIVSNISWAGHMESVSFDCECSEINFNRAHSQPA